MTPAGVLPSYLPGILAMLLGQLCFSINDALIKYSVSLQAQENSIFLLLFLRGLLVCAMTAGWLVANHQLHLKRLLTPNAMHLRGGIEVLLTSAFFASILVLPLSDVYTIMLSAPLMITASGALFLKERVHWKSWLAVVLGFCGVLVVVWPDELGWQPTYGLPVLSTVLLVIRELFTKRMATEYRGMEVVLVTSVLITFVAGGLAVPMGIRLQPLVIPYLIGSAVLLTVGYLMSVLTVRLAPLSITSPGRYSIIIFGATSAYVVLGEVPSLNTILGSLIIATSGLFIFQKRR
jgi:drug/metabolite transporter (DMT)-like permease